MRYIFSIIILLNFSTISSQNEKIRDLWQNFADTDLSLKIFRYAYCSISEIKPPNDTIISIIDFSKASTEKRFFVIDLKNEKIIVKTYVAHGMGTGENYALDFSNKSGSHKSSLGFYLTDKTYIGKHGYSLKLKGLEKNINDNAYNRAIVIHGAWYVSEKFIKNNNRLGRSWGCPSVSETEAQQLIDIIKNGSILFIYSNDNKYLQKSKFIN